MKRRNGRVRERGGKSVVSFFLVYVLAVFDFLGVCIYVFVCV